jgi:manganese oxidase
MRSGIIQRSIYALLVVCMNFANFNSILGAEDDVAEVLEALDEQIAKTPNDGGLYLRRSKLRMLSNRFDQALADLDQANRLSPIAEIDRERAQVYLSAGWFQTGVEHASRHLAAFPEDAQAYLVRARMRLKLGRHAEAGRDFSLSLQHTKDPPIELFLEHAQALTTQDGLYLNEALGVLEQGMQRLGPAHALQAAALDVELRQKNYPAALSRIDVLMEATSRKDTWLARRGDVLVQAGKIDEARVAYQRALTAITNLPPVQRNRAATRDLESQIKSLLLQSSDRATPPVASPAPSNPALSPAEPRRILLNTGPAVSVDGRLRSYFIAADEVDWHYAPGGNVLQEPFCGDRDAMALTAPGRIGLRFMKAQYRSYTDETFQRLELRSVSWQHLGILGPVIRAEVGDRIHVTFKNKTRFPASIHPHGVFYLKASEGSGYADGTSEAEKRDDVVMPGGVTVYDWLVPERAGPGPSDGSSIVWLYHSHVQAARDGNSGLIGAILVTAKGKARPDGTPTDVDREFVTLFNIFDENQSSYFDLNLQSAFGSSHSFDLKDPLFIESNQMHAINGFIFGNVPMMRMNQGERVRWYLLAMGSETDVHTAHWHGNSVLNSGHRTDVVELLPASMRVVDMVADNPGIWMYHCHVDDHMREGMSGRYEVSVPAPPR